MLGEYLLAEGREGERGREEGKEEGREGRKGQEREEGRKKGGGFTAASHTSPACVFQGRISRLQKASSPAPLWQALCSLTVPLEIKLSQHAFYMIENKFYLFLICRCKDTYFERSFYHLRSGKNDKTHLVFPCTTPTSVGSCQSTQYQKIWPSPWCCLFSLNSPSCLVNNSHYIVIESD